MMLYDTTEAGKKLGNLHKNDVRELIKAGKLHAKVMVVRGTGKRPRQYVSDAEIDRFIGSLPDKQTDADKPEPKPRRRQPKRLMKDLETVTVYHR